VVQPPLKGGASFFKVLTEGDSKKGETWIAKADTDEGKSNTTYTLTDITDSTIVIDFNGTSSTVSKAEMMGLETVTTMNNKFIGKIILDRATYIIRQKTVTTESTGNTEAMGSSMPVTSKTTMLITVTPRQD